MTEVLKHNSIVVMLLLLAACLLVYVLSAQISPIDFMQDDSYFYLQVASHILKGERSTFHIITPTNGYHPIWMLVSVLGVALAGSDKILSLNVIIALQALMFLGTAYYFYRITKLIFIKYWMVGLANLAIFMVNVSQALLRHFRPTCPAFSVIDLKAHFRGRKYVIQTLRLLPQNPVPVSIDHLFAQVLTIGSVNSVSNYTDGESIVKSNILNFKWLSRTDPIQGGLYRCLVEKVFQPRFSAHPSIYRET